MGRNRRIKGLNCEPSIFSLAGRWQGGLDVETLAAHCPDGHPPSGKQLPDALKEIKDAYIADKDASTMTGSAKPLI